MVHQCGGNNLIKGNVRRVTEGGTLTPSRREYSQDFLEQRTTKDVYLGFSFRLEEVSTTGPKCGRFTLGRFMNFQKIVRTTQ